MNAVQHQGDELTIAPGVRGIAPGFAFIEATGSLVTADTHFGYEDAIGSALPAWSTDEMAAALLLAIRRSGAKELIILGDIVHAPRLSDGTSARVRRALDALRAECTLTLIEGNHEGRGRANAIVGETHDAIERDGWTLLHGDRPPSSAKVMIGHLHPSLPLAAGQTVPAFLASPRVIVVPALTPYSPGLSATSRECLNALRPFGVRSFAELHLTACTPERLYAFGSIGAMLSALNSATNAADRNRVKRRILRPDTLSRQVERRSNIK